MCPGRIRGFLFCIDHTEADRLKRLCSCQSVITVKHSEIADWRLLH
jgi:hypothetical protein